MVKNWFTIENHRMTNKTVIDEINTNDDMRPGLLRIGEAIPYPY